MNQQTKRTLFPLLRRKSISAGVKLDMEIDFTRWLYLRLKYAGSKIGRKAHSAPPQFVQTKDPMVTFTYIGPLWWQSKQYLFSSCATIAFKIFVKRSCIFVSNDDSIKGTAARHTESRARVNAGPFSSVQLAQDTIDPKSQMRFQSSSDGMHRNWHLYLRSIPIWNSVGQCWEEPVEFQELFRCLFWSHEAVSWFEVNKIFVEAR